MSVAAPHTIELPEPLAVAEGHSLAKETLAGSVSILLLMTVAQRGVGFFRGMLFCRWLDPAQLGQWDLTFGFLMLAAPVTVLGLTGGYGRYLEHYRQRGQLRCFVRRTVCCVAVCVVTAVALLTLKQAWFAEAVFGSPGCESLLLLAAVSLAALVAFNTLFELFGGLRCFRLAATLQFFHSLLFAGLGIALALCWQPTATSIVAAFGLACLICCLGAIPVVRRTWRSLAADDAPLGQIELWRKLIPFAASVWITNWLANLFDVVDRWMIVHFSAADAATALAEVGHYHAARVLPLPLLAVAAVLRSAVLPHLSHDWEAGRRAAVVQQLNFVLKVWGLILLPLGAGLLWIAPTLFDVVFQGKYDGGLNVLSLTVLYLGWEGMLAVASSYLWCAERPGLSSLPLAIGLAVNIALNLVMVPRFGLTGAVIDTAIANLVALALIYALNGRMGAPMARGVWLISLAPVALLLGPAAATVVTLGMFQQAWCRQWLLSADEKLRLTHWVRGRLRRNR